MARRRSLLPLLTVAVSALIVVIVVPGFAEAHTDFDYSLPTDGASVGAPLDEITVAFTLPVTLVGNGFTVLDPQNNELTPFAVTDDDTVFRLQFDPPLAGGTVAVKYEVRAEDGHVLTGNFVFVVDAPVPTTAPATTAPTTTQATTPPTTAPASAAPATTTTNAATTDAATTDAVAPEPSAASTAEPSADVTGDDGGSGSGLLIAIAAAVALAAGGFLIVRSRTFA